ncbi:hypothetical protein GGR56DRAFT_675976 [Xylariaceae sp. FL0804]|nr:hypothetical protein GGR56DRAFT_675976 [Xylariaceae sp. FL0804]
MSNNSFFQRLVLGAIETADVLCGITGLPIAAPEDEDHARGEQQQLLSLRQQVQQQGPAMTYMRYPRINFPPAAARSPPASSDGEDSPAAAAADGSATTTNATTTNATATAAATANAAADPNAMPAFPAWMVGPELRRYLRALQARLLSEMSEEQQQREQQWDLEHRRATTATTATATADPDDVPAFPAWMVGPELQRFLTDLGARMVAELNDEQQQQQQFSPEQEEEHEPEQEHEQEQEHEHEQQQQQEEEEEAQWHTAVAPLPLPEWPASIGGRSSDEAEASSEWSGEVYSQHDDAAAPPPVPGWYSWGVGSSEEVEVGSEWLSSEEEEEYSHDDDAAAAPSLPEPSVGVGSMEEVAVGHHYWPDETSGTTGQEQELEDLCSDGDCPVHHGGPTYVWIPYSGDRICDDPSCPVHYDPYGRGIPGWARVPLSWVEGYHQGYHNFESPVQQERECPEIDYDYTDSEPGSPLSEDYYSLSDSEPECPIIEYDYADSEGDRYTDSEGESATSEHDPCPTPIIEYDYSDMLQAPQHTAPLATPGLITFGHPFALHAVPFSESYWCQPVVTLNQSRPEDRRSLWRWEFGSAITNHVLGTAEGGNPSTETKRVAEKKRKGRRLSDLAVTSPGGPTRKRAAETDAIEVSPGQEQDASPGHESSGAASESGLSTSTSQETQTAELEHVDRKAMKRVRRADAIGNFAAYVKQEDGMSSQQPLPTFARLAVEEADQKKLQVNVDGILDSGFVGRFEGLNIVDAAGSPAQAAATSDSTGTADSTDAWERAEDICMDWVMDSQVVSIADGLAGPSRTTGSRDNQATVTGRRLRCSAAPHLPSDKKVKKSKKESRKTGPVMDQHRQSVPATRRFAAPTGNVDSPFGLSELMMWEMSHAPNGGLGNAPSPGSSYAPNRSYRPLPTQRELAAQAQARGQAFNALDAAGSSPSQLPELS